MQPNVHTHERLEGESMKAYRERQTESRRRSHLGRYVRNPANQHANNARAIKRAIGARQYRIQRKERARAMRAGA